jgi:hypothetical protein
VLTLEAGTFPKECFKDAGRLKPLDVGKSASLKYRGLLKLMALNIR